MCVRGGGREGGYWRAPSLSLGTQISVGKENDAKQQQIIITKKLFEILFYLGTGALLLAHRAPRFGC